MSRCPAPASRTLTLLQVHDGLKHGTPFPIPSYPLLLIQLISSRQLLSASRQTFAFARDGALPLSRFLYRMNTRTGTPVNTVWFCASWSIVLGLLAFAGEGQAINAVFTISVTALYVAYSIPICARWMGRNEFRPGPFDLGVFVRVFSLLLLHQVGAQS